MGDLSKHFSTKEFVCKCGRQHDTIINPELIEKLEKLYDLLGATAIFINSGFRCPEYSKSVGGYMNDAHTKGIAADICCIGKGKGRGAQSQFFTANDIAEAAERVGFTGIGVITDKDVHVDIRTTSNYSNGHWFGDERTGKNNIKTFQTGRKFDGENVSHETESGKHKITVIVDGVTVYESEV